jgi:hypothetical protein
MDCRWSRYSLRALLGGVVLASIASFWLIWNIREERQRVEALASIKVKGGDYLWEGPRRANMPKTILRHVLGYRSIEGIRLPDAISNDELRRLEELFPEAEIWERVGDKNQRIERGHARFVAR